MRRGPGVLSAAGLAVAALAAALATGTVPHAVSAASPQAAVFPSTISFGTQRVNSVSERSVTVENTGNAPLRVYSVTVNDFTGSYSVAFNTCMGATLQPGNICQFYVRFMPRTPGQHNTTVYVRDNAPGSIQTVYVFGQATP